MSRFLPSIDDVLVIHHPVPLINCSFPSCRIALRTFRIRIVPSPAIAPLIPTFNPMYRHCVPVPSSAAALAIQKLFITHCLHCPYPHQHQASQLVHTVYKAIHSCSYPLLQSERSSAGIQAQYSSMHCTSFQ